MIDLLLVNGNEREKTLEVSAVAKRTERDDTKHANLFFGEK